MAFRTLFFAMTLCSIAFASVEPRLKYAAPNSPGLNKRSGSPHMKAVQHLERATTNTTETPDFSFDELWNMTNGFFENFLYPANIVQANSINSTLLAPDVLGRIDATRDFAGRELNTEYIFGLFANVALDPSSFTILGYPINYTITHFAANQNIISVFSIVYFNITALGMIVPQEVDVWMTFNADGQISQYDGTLRFLEWQVESFYAYSETLLGVNSTSAVESALQVLLAESICATATTYCNGTNTQYNSTSQCFDYLTQDVRLGEAYEWGMNTVVCRMVHQNMVPLRPDVHCAHIGPTGGGYCTDDRTYEGTVLEPYFVNAPFIPYGKGNSTL